APWWGETARRRAQCGGQRSWPHLPRRPAALPQAAQQLHVAERVHALPEAVVLPGGQLAGGRQAFQWVALEDRLITPYVNGDARLEDEEAAVDPALTELRFLDELRHQVTGEGHAAEPRRRADGGHGREPAVGAMKGEQPADVHVAHTVPVGSQ